MTEIVCIWRCRRYRAEGVGGLDERSSPPHRSPNQTKPSPERQVIALRRNGGPAPARNRGDRGFAKVVGEFGPLLSTRHFERATSSPVQPQVQPTCTVSD